MGLARLATRGGASTSVGLNPYPAIDGVGEGWCRPSSRPRRQRTSYKRPASSMCQCTCGRSGKVPRRGSAHRKRSGRALSPERRGRWLRAGPRAPALPHGRRDRQIELAEGVVAHQLRGRVRAALDAGERRLVQLLARSGRQRPRVTLGTGHRPHVGSTDGKRCAKRHPRDMESCRVPPGSPVIGHVGSPGASSRPASCAWSSIQPSATSASDLSSG
jgi:hypothetical protein